MMFLSFVIVCRDTVLMLEADDAFSPQKSGLCPLRQRNGSIFPCCLAVIFRLQNVEDTCDISNCNDKLFAWAPLNDKIHDHQGIL